MNALTRLIDAELVPTPPYFIQDFGASVLQQALVAQAASCDKVLICRTAFHRQGEELNWRVIFVPTRKMQDLMEQELH
jgi:chemotaxis protein CheC